MGYIRVRPSALLEVFSVSMFSHHIDDIHSADIQGKIISNDVSADPLELFKSDGGGDQDEDSILPDGTLRLTGPIRCISSPPGVIGFILKDKRNDLEICHGKFDTNYHLDLVPYDKRVTCLIPGQHGYAVVHFMQFFCAVQAIVEVSLVTTDDNQRDDGHLISCPESIYGFIRASNDLCSSDSSYDSLYFQSTLFYATKEKPKDPNHVSGVSKTIPLSRSVVAVPLEKNLVIKAQLFDSATEANIVDGNAYFMAATSGSVSEKIGDIMIKVNWLIDPFDTPGVVPPTISPRPNLPRKRTSGAISNKKC